MLCRTSSRLREVRPADTRIIDSKNLVRNRTLTITAPCADSANELIAYTVYRPEMHWIGGVRLQLLAQFQDVVIHRASGRVIVISPDFVQQFVTCDNTFWVLHHELQGFEFLCGKSDCPALAHNFHFAAIDLNVCEREVVTGGRFYRASQGG